MLENRYTNQLGLQQLQASQQNCCCETKGEILENRYENAIGQANIQKDMLLGQAGIQRDILIGNKDLQAQLNQCCCDLKTNIHLEAEATRNLMQQNQISELTDKLNVARAQLSNFEQSQYLLNTMGKYNVVSVPPCGCNQNYGCNQNWGYPYGAYYGVSSVV